VTRRAIVLLIAVLGIWHLASSPRRPPEPPAAGVTAEEDPPAGAGILRLAAVPACYIALLAAAVAGWKLLRIPDHGSETLWFCAGFLALSGYATVKVTSWSAG